MNWTELDRSVRDALSWIVLPHSAGWSVVRLFICHILNSTEWWTELDRSVQFGWVQFSFPLCTEPATTDDGRRRFLTVKNLRRPSPVVAARRSSSPVFVQRQTLHWLSDSRECISIVNNLRRPPISSPNRRKSSPVQCTAAGKLNWPEQFSWVQFSSVSRCALGLMKRRIPDNLLLLLESWFAIGMKCVKWHNVWSRWFDKK